MKRQRRPDQKIQTDAMPRRVAPQRMKIEDEDEKEDEDDFLVRMNRINRMGMPKGA
jgi:hypothetical protein